MVTTKLFFLKAFNSIFGTIGPSASEEVIFELIKGKCLPVFMYGLDVCSSNSADRHSLQFSVENSNLARRFITSGTDERSVKLGQRGSGGGHVNDVLSRTLLALW